MAAVCVPVLPFPTAERTGFRGVRGLVPRPRRIEVEHTRPDGSTAITVFTDALSHLVAHGVDHLHDMTCKARMDEGVCEGVCPIPVEECRGNGESWSYDRGAVQTFRLA